MKRFARWQQWTVCVFTIKFIHCLVYPEERGEIRQILLRLSKWQPVPLTFGFKQENWLTCCNCSEWPWGRQTSRLVRLWFVWNFFLITTQSWKQRQDLIITAAKSLQYTLKFPVAFLSQILVFAYSPSRASLFDKEQVFRVICPQ